MSAIWNVIETALNEAADPTNKLVAFIERRYGSHQADELTNWLVSNPKGDVEAHVRATYVDPEADKLAAKVAAFRNPKPAEDPKSKKKAEPADTGDPLYVDPEQAKAQQARTAATAAMRPDRAGVKPNVDKPTGVGGSQDTKSREFQAMGTAGQNPAQDQPSLVGGKEQAIHDKIAKLQALLNKDPRKPHPQADKIQRTIDRLEKMAAMAPGAVVPGNKPVPKTAETRELEKINALLRDEDALKRQAMKFVKAHPQVAFGDALAALKKKLKNRAAELGRAGSSTIKKTQKMEPDKFFKQGGSKTDVDTQDTGTKWDPKTKTFIKGEPAAPEKPAEPEHKGGTVKPNREGDFVGDTWMPAAFSKPEEDELGKNPAVDAARASGFGKKGVEYGDAAVGGMAKGAVAQNPAKPRSIKVGKEKWSDTHGYLWAGKAGQTANPQEKWPQAGWVTKSQFVALVAQGLIKRKSTDPSKPDLSKMNVVSPVNPPSSRANLDNTTGRPVKPQK